MTSKFPFRVWRPAAPSSPASFYPLNIVLALALFWGIAAFGEGSLIHQDIELKPHKFIPPGTSSRYSDIAHPG